MYTQPVCTVSHSRGNVIRKNVVNRFAPSNNAAS